MKADNNEFSTFIKLKYGRPSSNDWLDQTVWVLSFPDEVIHKIFNELYKKGWTCPYPGTTKLLLASNIVKALTDNNKHLDIIYKHLEEYESQDQR